MKVAIILISMTLSVIALRADPNAKQEQPIERSSRDEKAAVVKRHEDCPKKCDEKLEKLDREFEKLEKEVNAIKKELKADEHSQTCSNSPTGPGFALCAAQFTTLTQFVLDCSDVNGILRIQTYEAGNQAQIWDYIVIGGYFNIVCRLNGKVLQVGNIPGLHNPIMLAARNATGQDDQLWIRTTQDGIQGAIASKTMPLNEPGITLLINIDNNVFANGTQVITYPSTTDAHNQYFPEVVLCPGNALSGNMTTA